MTFNPAEDYCGCQSAPLWFRKCVPDKVFGVCLKEICYNHDQEWKSGDKAEADRDFRNRIRLIFKTKKPGFKGIWQGRFVACWYFLGVRFGGVRFGSMFYD